jgi:hypothetical protein
MTVETLADASYCDFDLLIQSSGAFRLLHVNGVGVYEITKGDKNINMVYICNPFLIEPYYPPPTTGVNFWGTWNSWNFPDDEYAELIEAGLLPINLTNGFGDICGYKWVDDIPEGSLVELQWIPLVPFDYNGYRYTASLDYVAVERYLYTDGVFHVYDEGINQDGDGVCFTVEKNLLADELYIYIVYFYNQIYRESLHAHDYTPSVTPPNCTEEGYTTYVCECGDSFIDDPVPATGHDYLAQGHTHGDGGVWYVCSNCGDAYFRETEMKTGWFAFYSNADGVNSDGLYYKQTDNAGVWDGFFDRARDKFTAPSDYIPGVGFTNGIGAQYIWTSPQEEIRDNDEAVFGFTYELPEAVSRVVLAYGETQSNGVGIQLYIASDCKYDLYFNNTLINPDLGPTLGGYTVFTETTVIREAIENSGCTALTIRIVARNKDVGGGTDYAMIMFAGAIAFEYEVFID